MGVIHYTISDDLHRRAKAAAAAEGMTLRAFIVALLEIGSTAALDPETYAVQDGTARGA